MRSGWALAACLALVGCGDERHDHAPAAVQPLVVSSLIDNVFFPMLREVEVSAGDLHASVESLCAGPDVERLDAARAAWRVARGRYKRTEVLAFGPHTHAPWRSASQLDFWPARPDGIDGVLAGAQDLSDPDTKLSAAARGLPAIEYVLFAPGHDLEWLQQEARRCEYLVFISARLVEDAAALQQAWVDTFADELRVAEGTTRYRDSDEAFGVIVNELGFAVQVMRDEKLGRPLGLKSGGTPQLDKLESRFAEWAVADMRENLHGIAAVFYGEYERAAGPGLARALGDAGADIGVFEAHWDTAMAGLDGIGGPLADVIETAPERVEAAMDALRGLQIYLQVDMAQALNVTTTFGGADGD